MNKAHFESLHVQVESGAQAHFRTTQNQYAVPNLRCALAQGPHDPGANESLSQEITHSFYEHFFR
jgi:hypothetical protein